ncbi:hypothetical protein BpHYR1_032796 [Brachionus plicatilis]|uniref:Uncharacterized protein n=1 Tax=Brachionus plicatilis TaxID=10195 RepID=A0A3M7STL7_BRAPC|nr:hypothetical protein BpHYR1_032796 [Brachionus plicatilis]
MLKKTQLAKIIAIEFKLNNIMLHIKKFIYSWCWSKVSKKKNVNNVNDDNCFIIMVFQAHNFVD